jgi:hypothetical protein
LRVTTLTIDEELGRLLGQAANARGKTLEQFAGEALRRAISENGGAHRTMRNGIPVMLVGDEQAVIDPEKIRRCLEEEGL